MTEQQKSRAFLALGGNLDNPRRAFVKACETIKAHPHIELSAASSLYRTPPVGGPTGQPDYLNAVIAVATGLPPQKLLDFCRQIENAAGRTRDIRWGARTLDIDLLFYEQLVLDTPELKLPHPRLQQRHFVLQPLVELAADYRHPLLHCSIAEILNALPAAAGITRLEDEWIDND